MALKEEMNLISNISSGIVGILLRNKIIDISEKAVYQYGFEILISSLITCIIAVAEGLAFKCLAASVIYFLIFAVLRTMCGGYHCQTYFRCNLVFAAVSAVVLSFYKFIPVESFSKMHYTSILLSLLITYFYSPIENKNKHLSEKQKKLSRIFGTLAVMALSALACVLKICRLSCKFFIKRHNNTGRHCVRICTGTVFTSGSYTFYNIIFNKY